MTRDKDECIERRKVMSELYSGWVKNVVKPQSDDSVVKRGRVEGGGIEMSR